MTTSEQMFLAVAEEMSFTRAADRNYVSQQIEGVQGCCRLP